MKGLLNSMRCFNNPVLLLTPDKKDKYSSLSFSLHVFQHFNLRHHHRLRLPFDADPGENNTPADLGHVFSTLHDNKMKIF